MRVVLAIVGLMAMIEKWRKSFGSGGHPSAFLTDLSKAHCIDQ